MRAADHSPKYRHVYQTLEKEIATGRLQPGARLPSEAELGRRFGASRITVGRAVRDLQLGGLVVRRAGAGTFVRAVTARRDPRLFGVLMPQWSETEIFDPIAQGLMSAPVGDREALMWSGLPERAGGLGAQAWELCRQYIDQRVAGVFFAPLEHVPARDEINQRIVEALDAARIPVVLLDRPIQPYPARGQHDLVGIDNRRAGFTVTEHLLRLGCRRIAFVGLPRAAYTVDARIAGYLEALHTWRVNPESSLVWRVDPAEHDAVRQVMAASAPDAIVCANDRTAALLMQGLIALGYAIPGDVRLVGIDDVEYAGWLPVPLTTLRQPCREIGMAALAAMRDRLVQPSLPPRDIFLHCSLVVRASCGAGLQGHPPSREAAHQ